MAIVFAVWCNDRLLDLYWEKWEACNRLDLYRSENPGGDWYTVHKEPLPRMAQRNGHVARLEVEELEVK